MDKVHGERIGSRQVAVGTLDGQVVLVLGAVVKSGAADDVYAVVVYKKTQIFIFILKL